MDSAVFYDPSRKRWWWIKRIGTLLGLVTVVTSTFCVLSVFVLTPLLPGMPAAVRRAIRHSIHLPNHQTQRQLFLSQKDREKLLAQIASDQQKSKAARTKLAPMNAQGVVAAFYAPWQEQGIHSLEANATKMTHLLPAWVHLREEAKGLDYHDWDNILVPHNIEVVKIARDANLAIVPVFSNAQISATGSGEFDGKRAHILLTNPAIQDQIIAQLRTWLMANRFQGINIDFENMQESDYALMVPFCRRVKTAFAPYKLIVTADLEASKPLNWRAMAAICDFVVVMAYDEHASTDAPGPIASLGWYRSVLQRALRGIPRDKLVVGLGNYAYDWTKGNSWAEPMTYQSALIKAKANRPGETPAEIVDFDPDALNPTFWYDDEDGNEHEVWFLDAVTAANQWMVAQNYGVRGVAIWVLGSTDPSIFTFLHRDRLNQLPNVGVLREVKYPYDVEFVGDGEILHVEALAHPGQRSLEVDKTTGLILDEDYSLFPTSIVIGRSGYKPNTIALTIDDGPADPYTDQILDILKRYNIKATFFLIGENAQRYQGLVRRIWNEGHEIGSHTYTHPNIATVSPNQVEYELNATQRLFQSLLHHSTLLFRAPYNADAEPTSVEEVRPVEIASARNYITVGEFLDPQDWNPDERLPNGTIHHRTAEDMLQSVLAQLGTEQGSCVLLHDGGGNRVETVRLLPMLINELTKRGYKFVPVSALIDATREQVMPPVTKSDNLMLANDRIVFEAFYLFELFLSVAFISAIVLGTVRVFFVTVLALLAKRRERHVTFDDTYQPHVTVVIAAYNEEKVVVRTVESVLENAWPSLDVIVIDDGSKDATFDALLAAFAGDSRVEIMQQENGGKASALNRGIAKAGGEIIIALDADTIFARDTIAKLVRHFADPIVGAVAGNVKVGNRVNPLTYWQAIEYITSQNLDRRAYSFINSVSVVPGAVGAWRREAILQAGGYTTDTMAEDMDLTWRIRRIGWRIDTETDAIGYTEAPQSFGALFKQRFRWAFGTLQSLWKHRLAVGRYGWFGRVMLPSLWLFQIVYQTLSPLVDLQILWSVGSVIRALMRGRLAQDWQPLPQALASLYIIAFMYAFFFVVELIGSFIAFKLDNEDPKVLVWLFWQRFLYRQLMYAVLIKSLKTAASGIRAGWGKLERKGTVELATEHEA